MTFPPLVSLLPLVSVLRSGLEGWSKVASEPGREPGFLFCSLITLETESGLEGPESDV